jgi:hypothetical protein
MQAVPLHGRKWRSAIAFRAVSISSSASTGARAWGAFRAALFAALALAIVGCKSTGPLSLCEVVNILSASPLKDITAVEWQLTGVRENSGGRSVITLSAQPHWRSLLVNVDKTADNTLGVERRTFGPLEWLEPSDTAELRILLERQTRRRVDTTIVRDAVWLLAQRRSFGIEAAFVMSDCDEFENSIPWLPAQRASTDVQDLR